ncbi:proline iminopeptidase [Bacillus subtilis]|nr:proline iminopeptidase [Bacillus subtilis]
MIPEKKSIAIMKELSIGNTKQMLMINGVDVKNPLLLFLHGGRERRKSDMLDIIKKSWNSILQ